MEYVTQAGIKVSGREKFDKYQHNETTIRLGKGCLGRVFNSLIKKGDVRCSSMSLVRLITSEFSVHLNRKIC